MPRIPIKTRRLLRKVIRNIQNDAVRQLLSDYLSTHINIDKEDYRDLKYILEIELKLLMRKISQIYLLLEIERRDEYIEIINNRLKRLSCDRLEYLLNRISNTNNEILIYLCKND